MALRLEQKKQIVAEISDAVNQALSVVAADYRGLTSPQMTELRARARKAGVTLKIVRNTLARRAFADTPYEGMADQFVGPTILAFATEEPGATARLIRDFAKEHESLEVKVLSLSGQVYDKSQLNAIASLPTYDEAVAKLLSVMQAPVVKFVRTIREPHAKLVRLMAAVRDKKQAESA